MIVQDVNRMAYMKTQNVMNRDYYGTPPEFVDMARKVMGSIELDPASCLEANSRFIHASRFYDEQADGLQQSWATPAMWLNPPYSGRGAYEFARKFAEEAAGITQAVVLVNSATGTRAFRYLFDNCDAICFCSRRIQFIDPSGMRAQSNNSKEQLFFYRGRRVARFMSVFCNIGRIVRIRL